MGATREELAKRFGGPGDRLQRAMDAVHEGRVKRHVFIPSGRALYTVVGRIGDEFIDPGKPFCSCESFFFRFLGGRKETCYHLLAYHIAEETNSFSEVSFHDEEFRDFLGLLSLDLLGRVGDKEDKHSRDRSDTVPR